MEDASAKTPRPRNTPLKQDENPVAETAGKKPKRAKKESAASGKHEKLLQTIGVICTFVSIFLLFSFVSYLINWFDDRSSDDIFSNLTFQRILSDSQVVANNMGGRAGAALSAFFIKQGFGIGAFFMVIWLFFVGIRYTLKYSIRPLLRSFLVFICMMVWLSVALGFLFKNTSLSILGGVVGYELSAWLEGFIGKMGLVALLLVTFICFLILAYNLSLYKLKDKVQKGVSSLGSDLAGTAKNTSAQPGDKHNLEQYAVDEKEEELLLNKPIPDAPPVVVETPKTVETQLAENVFEITPPFQKETPSPKAKAKEDVEFTVETPTMAAPVETTPGKEEPAVPDPAVIPAPQIHNGLDIPFDPRAELSTFQLPGLDLLDDYGDGTVNINKEELETNKNRILETLGNYGIQIDKIKATIGPTVTLYEIIPAPGVRISRIKSLEDDIALSLSALGIRIIAPIPGKGTIGIEVPNQKPEIVGMKAVLASEKFAKSSFELPFGIGKNIQNEVFVADLAKMPHILMAGATGQGKSVGLNAIIASLLYKKHPSELKFVMVDPKKVELTLFSRIERHYLAKLPDSEEAIITDTSKVVRTLKSLNIEMDARYDLLKDAQVRNIKEYNTKFIERKLNPLEGHRFLPYIVLVVDEFADLIMTAGKEIEVPIARLAQLARAIGIHLIIATQRPSVNIITGIIKANFPARVAFRVTSKIDSRTILDQGGADQLIGRGDLLLSTGNDLIRLQCAFLDTHEVERITSFIGSQRGFLEPYALPECADEENNLAANEMDPSERDEFFEDAARVIVLAQQGSTSLIQRKLKLGYNRAGRIIDQLEAAGIVGPFEGSKAREVKIGSEMALEQFLKDLYSKDRQTEL